MRAILLDGSRANDRTGVRVRASLTAELQRSGWDVIDFTLRNKRIGNCAGDFYCWVRTPGMCNVNDDNRIIAAEIANCNLIVYLTPVTFGGYSSVLKSMVDHQIQNVSPFFEKIEDETHHRTRYANNPDLLVVGWMDAPDATAEAVFRHLVQRNAINFHARTWISGVVQTSSTEQEIAALAQQWLGDLQHGQPSPRVALPRGVTPESEPIPIRRALLLVGSPKTRKSSSHSLGSYLFEQLSARSVEVETIYVHTVLRNPQRRQALLEAVDAADLVTLAFPLYVDCLPAPVMEAMERITAHRQERQPLRHALFTAIANCGFPEAHHCFTALAICEMFCRHARLAWAGGLALGGGQMLNGVPLVKGGGQTVRIRQSLDLAAAALASGRTIPVAAHELMARPVIPHRVYRLLGALGWIRAAKDNGALRMLRRQPYLGRDR